MNRPGAFPFSAKAISLPQPCELRPARNLGSVHGPVRALDELGTDAAITGIADKRLVLI